MVLFLQNLLVVLFIDTYLTSDTVVTSSTSGPVHTYFTFTCGPVLTYSTSDPVYMFILTNGLVLTYSTCGLVLT